MALDILQQSVLNKSRVDKFRMIFQLPTALKTLNKKLKRGDFYTNQDSVQLSIYGSIVPKITVPALEIRYSGSTLYTSTHIKRPYPPVTVNFTVDSLYNNYWTIYQWLNLLHDQKTGLFDDKDLVSDDVFEDYQTDITIFGLNEFNKEVIEFKYVKAFPTDLNEIKYDYRAADQLESGFTFTYSQLHVSMLN